MSYLSLEEEMNEEIEKALKEYRGIVDKDFERRESYVKSYLAQSNELCEVADKINNWLKVRSDTVVTKSELELVSSLVALQAKLHSHLSTITYTNIIEIKEIAYNLVNIPLKVVVKAFSAFVENFPNLSLETRKTLEEKLKPLQEDIQQLKEKKEIELKVPEDVKEELKEWARERERIKKAMKQAMKQYST